MPSFPSGTGGGALSPFVPFTAAPSGAQPGCGDSAPGCRALGVGEGDPAEEQLGAVGAGGAAVEERKTKLSLRSVCCREPPARAGAGTDTTDRPLPCLPPAQGSHGCRQPVPRGLVPRGHGSLEQERRWKQYLEDERIALFLQNEEFMKELQRNRDFLLALERGEKRLQKHLPRFFGCVPPPSDAGHWQRCFAFDIVACAKAEPAQDVARLVVRPADTGQWAAPQAPAPGAQPPATRLSSP